MFSRPLGFILLGLVSVTAAAGGAYVAARNNAADAVTAAPASVPEPAPVAQSPAAAQPVAETEAAVTPAAKTDSTAVAAEREPAAAVPAPPKRPAPRAEKPARTDTRVAKSESPATPVRQAPRPAAANGSPAIVESPAAAPTAPPPPAPEPARPFEPQPEPPRVPQFEEVILPASSVISLQIESTLSTERARVEDRVDARVTRDVLAAGRVAIPAGSRVLGSVTLVDRGGKVKERARLGVRFHTLVLANGSEVPLQTEPVYRDGESPTGDSTKKIGGAAVGGAILGAILGGKKGAAVGAATGAAGGTAAVMAGDRNAATLSRGDVITPRLSAPATITVEKRE